MRWIPVLILLVGIGHCLGCEKVEEVDRGDPSSPIYVSDPDPRAYSKHYTGSPLDVDRTKKLGKKQGKKK